MKKRLLYTMLLSLVVLLVKGQTTTPSDTQMTTYDPLIGMTSSTDPNGKTTYYEYDTFGRLQFVKDDQGKILNKYDYNYSTQN